MRRYLVTLIFSACATAQGYRLVGPVEPLPKTPPAAEALHESKSLINPDDAYRELLSGDPERIVRTYNALDLSWIGEWPPIEVRALAMDLDGDKKLERVLIIDNLWNTAVVVLRREDDVWWRVGVVLCGAPRGNCPKTFVELRQTVWYGTNDLIFHTGGSIGPGLSENRLQIYRMFAGRLYPVLDVIEDAADWSGQESSKFHFRDPESSANPATVVVHRTKEFRRRRTSACIPYVWNVDKFAFLPVPATRQLCAPAN